MSLALVGSFGASLGSAGNIKYTHYLFIFLGRKFPATMTLLFLLVGFIFVSEKILLVGWETVDIIIISPPFSNQELAEL